MGTRLKSRQKPCLRKSDARPFSKEVFSGFSFEVKWKEAMGRFLDQARLFFENPRSKMKKRDLLRLLDELWDLIPERAQRVGRKDMPESMLYTDWPEKPKKKEEEDGQHAGR